MTRLRNSRDGLRAPRVCIGVATIALLLSGSMAFAEGPVAPMSLPGGVGVNDDDSGSGERWGRFGGRTITFNVNDPSLFTSLTWGAVGPDPVTLAFDNSVDAAGETLTLDVGQSNLPGGVAVWTGNAVIPLISGSLTLSTRFTLTVDDGLGGAVPLSSVPGGNDPGGDVLATGGTIRAKMIFEALHNGTFGIAPGWRPVLELYDDPRLPTIPGGSPGTSGPVLTSFSHGFFYDTSGGGGGLDLDEHDANMFSQTNMIKADLAFLTTDAINRLQMLATGQQEIRDGSNGHLQAILEAIDRVSDSFPQIPTLPDDIASSEDVQNLQDGLTEILLILFGLAPCPDEAPCTPGEPIKLFASPEDVQKVQQDVASALTKLMDIQALLEASSDTPELHIEVVDSASDGLGRYRRWVLATTVDGQLVDASLVRAVAITLSGLNPASTEDVTMFAVPVSLGPGLLDLSMSLPPNLRNASAFELDMFFDDGTVVASGTILVSGNPRR